MITGPGHSVTWVCHSPQQTWIVHGEPDAADTLRMRLKDELHWPAHVAEHGQRVEA